MCSEWLLSRFDTALIPCIRFGPAFLPRYESTYPRYPKFPSSSAESTGNNSQRPTLSVSFHNVAGTRIRHHNKASCPKGLNAESVKGPPIKTLNYRHHSPRLVPRNDSSKETQARPWNGRLTNTMKRGGGKPNLQTTKITLCSRESINKADQRGGQN